MQLRGNPFNPRTREECDQTRCSRCILLQQISIHALARSATSKIIFKGMDKPKFQSTHSRGVRPAERGAWLNWIQ